VNSLQDRMICLVYMQIYKRRNKAWLQQVKERISCKK